MIKHATIQNLKTTTTTTTHPTKNKMALCKTAVQYQESLVLVLLLLAAAADIWILISKPLVMIWLCRPKILEGCVGEATYTCCMVR